MGRRKNRAVEFNGCSWSFRTKILTEDGTTRYATRSGYKTEKEAATAYKQYEEEFEKANRAFQMRGQVDANAGLRNYLIHWFEDMYSQRVEPTTRMLGAYTLYDLLLPCMEQDIKLRLVNPDYLDALLDKASKACSSAGNKCREFLNIALKDAVMQGHIKYNPVSGTRTYGRKKPTVIILTKDKIKILLKAAALNNWYLEILLALFCGLRKGEISGLKFCDIDLDKMTVSISRQITSDPVIPKGASKPESYGVKEKEPKTENSYRTLRIPDVIAKEVRKRKVMVEINKEKYGSDYYDGDYISCQKNGLPHSTSSFNSALSKLCSRNGLPHITVHGLRHMYATILIEQGVPLVKISALLGHSSVNTTFEYYCDVMDENEEIIGFMNSHFVPDGKENYD